MTPDVGAFDQYYDRIVETVKRNRGKMAVLLFVNGREGVEGANGCRVDMMTFDVAKVVHALCQQRDEIEGTTVCTDVDDLVNKVFNLLKRPN